MATKVKPTRLQITGTPQAGQVPVYVDDNCFCWGAGGGGGGSGDMEKCVYDPNNCNDDAFDYCNFYNTPDMSCYAQCSDIPTDNCELSNGCGYAKSCDLCSVATSGQYCDLSGQPTIPTDNCQLNNGCGYITGINCNDVTTALGYTPYDSTNPNGYTSCTGTLVPADIANLAQCCDIPTDNCQLANGCNYVNTNYLDCNYFCKYNWNVCADNGFILGTSNGCGAHPTGSGTISGISPSGIASYCIDMENNSQTVTSYQTNQITHVSVNSNNQCCTCYTFDKCPTGIAQICDIPDTSNLAQCCDIPTDNCQLTNGCGYTTCTGTLVSSDIACVNGCCLTNGGNITISGGADYSWCTQTISGGNVTLCLRTIVNVPTSDFTLVKPATLLDGEEYAIRVISESSYCMCLGSCFTNPRNVDTTLSGNATDQYVFLAIGGELELQPLVDTGA